MKAREVRERLKGKVEHQVSYCIEAIAEQMSVYDQRLMDMAMQIDAMTNILSNFMNGLDAMQKAADRQASMKGEGDDGSTTL